MASPREDSPLGVSLPGRRFNIGVSFPWEEGIFIRVLLYERGSTVPVERWEQPISDRAWRNYSAWIRIAKHYLANIIAP